MPKPQSFYQPQTRHQKQRHTHTKYRNLNPTSRISSLHPQIEQTCPFSRLPLEIRELTYGHLLPSTATLHPNVDVIFRAIAGHEHGRSRFQTHETVLALARTCQGIYAEVMPFYYRTKAFSFNNAYDLYRYLYMIRPFHQQQVQGISLWLRGSISSRWTTPNQRVYEWACEMLTQCRLHKLGIGVSESTKDGRMGSGPVKGLDALTGMGLTDLEVRDMLLDDQPESERFFELDVVSALGKRLYQNMRSEKGDISNEEKTEEADGASGVGDEVDKSRSAPKKGRGKRGASDVTPNKGKKKARIGKVEKGKSK